MNEVLIVLQFLIFPGLLFTAVAGLLTSWVDRKVTARVQMRVGPPFLQPFFDIGKLMIKETCVPSGSPLGLFLGAPLIGLASATLASTILWRALLDPGTAFMGDLIVLVYLLAMPALAVILGAFASHNPLASLGGSREMKLLLAYELPFILVILVPVIQSGSILFSELLVRTAAAQPSGVLALAVGIVCMQAKLALVPFDMAEAETELSGGAIIEYSGPPLAVFKLTRAMMLFTVPLFLVTLFAGGAVTGNGWPGAFAGAGLWLLLVVIVVVIRNTTPRLRIDQAVRFFWGPVSAVAAAAVVLALIGW